MIWLFLALLCFLCAFGIAIVLWLFHTYTIARRLVSRSEQRKAGVVAHKSSTTATTEVIRPRKGVGYTQGDK
jgi:peptidoglycan/LPS O-acetylase OafA/YrhL